MECERRTDLRPAVIHNILTGCHSFTPPSQPGAWSLWWQWFFPAWTPGPLCSPCDAEGPAWREELFFLEVKTERWGTGVRDGGGWISYILIWDLLFFIKIDFRSDFSYDPNVKVVDQTLWSVPNSSGSNHTNKGQTWGSLTISPLFVSLLSQTFLGQVLVLIFVPLTTEVIFTGLKK